MKTRTHQRGQGLLETVLVLPLLVFVAVALTSLLYRSMIFYFVDYQLHEALVCSQSERISVCKKHLQDNIQKLLLPRTRLLAQLNQSSFRTSGHVEVHLQPPFKISKELRIPQGRRR